MGTEGSGRGSTHAGRVALLTGASSGLGRAIAEEMAARGATVVVTSRDAKRAGLVAEAIRATGGQADGWAADLTRPEQIEAAVRTTLDRRGALHAVLFNTGGPKLGSFFDLADEDWLEGMEATLLAFVRLVRASVPRLAASDREPGHILAIVSSSVKEGIDNLTLSNTFRPAVAALVRSLARELAPRHVIVNAIAPGRFDTERVAELDRNTARRRGISAEQARAESVARIPMGRYGDPREIGRVAAFLLSPENTYLTGQTILVDGGMVRAL